MTPANEDRINPTREYERKFLVEATDLFTDLDGVLITQAYLWRRDGYAIRVRQWQTLQDGQAVSDGPATLTLKGPRTSDGSRLEVEMELPLEDATAIATGVVESVSKVRYQFISERNTFEVDEFKGTNAGLWIAEFEGSKEAVALLKRPWWCGLEVTGDPRYDNENLARAPWPTWRDQT